MQPQRKQSLLSDAESEQVQIYFSARKLADLDIVTVTDSYLEVYLQQTNKPRKRVLKTKICWNDLNPDYSETLVTQFFFEIRQMIIIEVYHEASPPKLIGTVQASIGQVFGARQKGLQRQIIDTKNKPRGTLHMKCEKVERGTNKLLQFDLTANDLPNQSWFSCFGGTSPMFRLYKMKNNAEYLLYESEIRDGTDVRFKKVVLNEKKLCNNNPDQPIILNMYHYSNFGAPKIISQTTFTINELRGKRNFVLRKDGKNRGNVQFNAVKRYTKFQFSDYLMAGMQVALVICVDFTASNGVPSNAQSLHYSTGHKRSQYEQALKQVTNILLDYDADKLVPTYGFGAKVRMPNFHTGVAVHHCFPLNGNTENPNFFQLQGIMKGYRECMKNLQFGGPTYFAPLLREAMAQCQKFKEERQQYMVLLILTDGAIHDTEIVEDLLVKCGKLPLSVIIVGIGNGDWGLMHRLDDDDCLMTDLEGNKTQRDLVQFVQFSEHQNNGVELARQVLFELPRQVEEYNMLNGLTPDHYKPKQMNTDEKYQMKRY